MLDWGPARQPDTRPYFFLSYAHTPHTGVGGGDPDHWVHVLFADLCEHIMQLTDLPAGASAGFMDRELRSGDGWPEALSRNLALCRVFVPLFSPRYFASEMCGREWYAFNERILRARALGGVSVPAIVPALWTGLEMEQLPDSVRHIHVDHAAVGAHYAKEGIYGLIKLSRLRDDYQEAVMWLARRIVRVATESPLPPGSPRDYERTPSAFKPRGHGPRRLILNVAAPTRDGLPDGRDPGPYGEQAQEWNPYPSESAQPLPALAEELIRSLDYRITVCSFDDQVAEGEADPATQLPDEKAAPEGPVILLVDRWGLVDEERRRRLKAFDTTAGPWVNAIVPWSRVDGQCQGEAGRRLVEAMEQTLPQTLARGRRTDCRTAVNGVPTLRAFHDVLPAVVANSTRLFLKHATAHPPAGVPIPKPRLRGPVAEGDPPDARPRLRPGPLP